MLELNRPTHKHDCNSCKFLGGLFWSKDSSVIDCYSCGGSVIARHSDDGPDYESAPVSAANRSHSVAIHGALALLIQDIIFKI